jgi:dihydrolipoamide dehydrogenase
LESFDLIVIGAGPGGYVAAIRAAQLGLKTACVEKEKALGGTCLRVGCIPSKALLEASHAYAAAHGEMAKLGVKVSGLELDLPAMLKHKDAVVYANTSGVDGLFTKNKIKRLWGTGRLAGRKRVVVTAQDGAEQEIAAERILIATGSEATALPGMEIDGKIVGTSDQAIAYDRVPERMIVIGGGVIGLELGSVWSRLGARVTVLEYLPRLLAGMDDELASTAFRVFGKQGISFRLGAKVTSARAEGGKGVVKFVDDGGADQVLEAERVLVAVGRRPYTAALGLETVGITPGKRGEIAVDDHFRTTADGVWAIGDVIPGPMLAHKAEEEGIAAVENMVGRAGHVNYDAIPSVVYTNPEIASVGKTEAELKAAGIPYRKGSFPFRFNGRARAMNETEGFVKVLAHETTDRILGVHILGAHAGDLIAEAALAIDMMASAEDVARTSHAHPTLAEAFKEAALGVEKRAIHM